MVLQFMKPAEIVSALLDETEHACYQCEKEFGTHNPNASHGLCQRHLAGSYRQMGREEKAREIESRPASSFPPDLAGQRQG